MRSEEEIKAYLTSTLYGKLKPLEEQRLRKIKQVKTGFRVSIAMAVNGIFLILLYPLASPVLLFLSLLTAVLSVNILLELNKKLRVAFKFHILKRLMEFMFDDFTYMPHQRISKKALQDSLLISGNIAKVEGEDYMRFRIGETAVHFSEVQAYAQSENYSVFTGIFLSACFNKTFRSETVVMPRKFKFLAKNYHCLFRTGFRRVNLEDPEFRKNFVVFSNDQVEARYLLTTSMMQRLLDYREKTRKPISVSFTRNLLNCAIPNYINLFEPALFESFFDFAFLRKSYDALKLYTGIVDDLNLNVRIWNA